MTDNIRYVSILTYRPGDLADELAQAGLSGLFAVGIFERDVFKVPMTWAQYQVARDALEDYPRNSQLRIEPLHEGAWRVREDLSGAFAGVID